MNQNDTKSKQKGAMGGLKSKMDQNDFKSDQKRARGALRGKMDQQTPNQTRRGHGSSEGQNEQKLPQITPERTPYKGPRTTRPGLFSNPKP